MSQSQDWAPILTLSNWYAWEQRAVNAIANFSEAGKAVNNNTLLPSNIFVDPIDGMTKIRIAERPWSDTMD